MTKITSEQAEDALEALDIAMCAVDWSRCSKTSLQVGEAWSVLHRFIVQNPSGEPLTLSEVLDQSNSIVNL